MKTAYVGFVTTVHPDWKQFCPQLSAPGNYKDPIKIQDWLDKATEKQMNEACDKPLTGKIAEFHLIERGDDGEARSLGAAGWPEATILEIISGYDRIFVLKTGVFATLTRMEHLDARGRLLPAYDWIITSRLTHVPLLRDACNAPKLFDPVDLLVSSTADENCNTVSVMRRITRQEEPRFNGRTAEERALLALEVAGCLGA